MKFLFTLLIIWLLGTLFFRLIFPWLLKRWVKKTAEKMNPNFQQEQENIKQKRKQGEVNIDYIPENTEQKEDDEDDGEYVDFEEIK